VVAEEVEPLSTRPMNVLSGCCSNPSDEKVSLSTLTARRSLWRVAASTDDVVHVANEEQRTRALLVGIALIIARSVGRAKGDRHECFRAPVAWCVPASAKAAFLQSAAAYPLQSSEPVESPICFARSHGERFSLALTPAVYAQNFVRRIC